MRILLASNSPYYPSFGGGNKSNRLLMEALAARGHTVRVVTRTAEFGPEAHRQLLDDLASREVAVEKDHHSVWVLVNGVDVHILARQPMLRQFMTAQIEEFAPDVILTSTDDPAHLMLLPALESDARVVYLIRATVALPFGPDSSLASDLKTQVLARTDGVVTVSEYVADYARRHGGLDAVHVPISLLDSGPYPELGSFENPYVTMVNPCGVKGLPIFLGLADRLPGVAFAAVPTWGTTPSDIAEMQTRPNIRILPAVDDIDEVLRLTRVMLVPSLWAEARSRVILESMSRGIPVLASDVGGLREAKLGVDYLLPVNPVLRYRPLVDELMVPVADIPPQDVEPWQVVLQQLVADRELYTRVASQSRQAALGYAHQLNALPFDSYLENIVRSPKRSVAAPRRLTEEKRRLLALRLRAQGTPAD
jgi:glycosyltransferase involved in cell wall biosynthesis